MLQDPQAQLAKMYVEEFLRDKGLTTVSVLKLPEEQAKQIMVEASTYAALKLAEMERRAQIVHELHGASQTE